LTCVAASSAETDSETAHVPSSKYQSLPIESASSTLSSSPVDVGGGAGWLRMTSDAVQADAATKRTETREERRSQDIVHLGKMGRPPPSARFVPRAPIAFAAEIRTRGSRVAASSRQNESPPMETRDPTRNEGAFAIIAAQ